MTGCRQPKRPTLWSPSDILLPTRRETPLSPPLFISTASPTSSRFLGIASDRRARNGADADSKFPCDGFPAVLGSTVGPALNCPLQDPEKTSENQGQHQPAQRVHE